MKANDIISLRKKAEESVSDMADGPLRLKAFEVILQSLLGSVSSTRDARSSPHSNVAIPNESRSSFSSRLDVLVDEDFFSQPRSLAEIQEKLAEHGWHYPLGNISSPLVRLVRQRRLRRLQVTKGKKKLWKYAMP